MQIPEAAIRSAAQFVSTWAKQQRHTEASSECCNCNGTFLANWTYKLIERIAALEAQLARLSAPVSDAEWHLRSNKIYCEGGHDWLLFREDVDAILAARREGKRAIPLNW